MHQIPLRRRDGRIVAYAVVDDQDAHLGDHRWFLSSTGYVRRTAYPNGKRGPAQTIGLHREVMGVRHGDRRKIDHIDHDLLNNTRANLRIVNHAQNHQNRRGRKDSSSRYRGVSWRRDIGMWQAYAFIDGKQRNIGFFEDEHEAGRMAAIYRQQNMPYSLDAQPLVDRMRRWLTQARPLIREGDPDLHAEIMADPVWIERPEHMPFSEEAA